MNSRILFVIFLTITLSPFGFAQSLDKAKLDNYFDALENNNKFMGSVAVTKDGDLIYARSLGYSDIENNIKAEINTKYRIGSISKTFTAVLVMKALEEQKLELSQTIDLYFPTITNAKNITIEHLLRHRSGIHNFTNDADFLTYNTEFKSEEEMILIIEEGGSDFEPDSKSEYSNSNYVLLTYILEKIYRKSYSELIQDNIAIPIGLTNTYFGGKIDPTNNESKSYRFSGSWKLESETDVSIPLGAGSIVSTPSDLTKFSDALFNVKILTKESLELMKTIKDGFGFGLFQIPFYDKLGLGHTGGIDGFSSVFSYFAHGNISYALTSNGSNFNNNDITIAILSELYDQPYDIPEFSTYEVSSQDLDQYLGIYSSKEMPLKITITKDNSTLIAQATGQPSFPLDASKKDHFKFDQAGVVLEFEPTKKKMILKQGGGVYTFTKE